MKTRNSRIICCDMAVYSRSLILDQSFKGKCVIVFIVGWVIVAINLSPCIFVDLREKCICLTISMYNREVKSLCEVKVFISG